MKHLIWTAFIALLFLLSSCEEKPNTGTRSFDEKEIAELNDDKQFDYDKAVEAKSIEPAESKPSESSGILGYIFAFFNQAFALVFIIVLIGIVVFFIIKNSAYRSNGFHRTKQANLVEVDSVEDLVFEDFEARIKKAVSEGLYREAVRYVYLNTLKQLHKAKVISWNKEKTNSEYLSETKSFKQNEFKDIIYIYEHVWYGVFPVSLGLCQHTIALSDSLKKQLV